MLSESERYALARKLTGLPRVEGLVLHPIVEQIINREHSENDIQDLQKFFGHEILEEIFKADPQGEPPKLAEGWQTIHVPELPKYAQLSDKAKGAAKGVAKLMDEYMAWITKGSSQTDPIFLESGWLWLIGVATARRAVLHLTFDSIYNLLYVMWVAPTTRYAKSTGLGKVRRLAKATFPHLLMASNNTSELLLYKMAGQLAPNMDKLPLWQQILETEGQKFAGQRAFIVDEASTLFTKKYYDGLPEFLMECYDCPDTIEHEFKGSGKLVVNQPGLSLMMATTPARMSTVLGDGEWEDGFLARFAMLTPTRAPGKPDDIRRARDARIETIPTRLMQLLRQLHDRLPAPPGISALEAETRPVLPSVEVEISDEALEIVNNYNLATKHDLLERGVDERQAGPYGRLTVQMLKVAMSLALTDWIEQDGKPVISLGHAARAQMIVESWRASAHRLLHDLNVSVDVKIENKILGFLKQGHREPPTESQILRGLGMKIKRSEFNAAVAALMRSGMVAQLGSQSAPRYMVVM